MASQEFRRRSSVVVLDRVPAADPLLVNKQTTTTTAEAITTTAVAPTLPPRPIPLPNKSLAPTETPIGIRANFIDPDVESMPPPPVPCTPAASLKDDEPFSTRPSRSASSSSRNTNRLSLTLPIAPPTSEPSRPTPSSSTAPSYPPTPVDVAALASPIFETNDFIIAVAAQERRVLELREELSRAESELGRLKKQWATHEQYKKRSEIRNMEPLRPIPTQTSEVVANNADDALTRRSVELDRRKALLQSAQNSPAIGSAVGTPTSARRKVFRGAHARTLSLVSPAKPDATGFAVHEDPRSPEAPEPVTRAFEPFRPAPASKRASWQPRSFHSSVAAGTGVKQMAEDFKMGLWSFVEDIRQATVGDEPINGTPDGGPSLQRGVAGQGRSPAGRRAREDNDGGEDTLRAPAAPRPRLSSAFDLADGMDAPSGSARASTDTGTVLQERANSKVKGTKAKHFSWTPLTFDSFDDNDWSNWESPASAKSTRWSGSTVSGENIPPIPERGDETPLKKKSTFSSVTTPDLSAAPSPTLLSPSKLEDLLPQVVNRLSPTNIKRTATDLMNQWEKSLASPTEPPAVEMKEGSV